MPIKGHNPSRRWLYVSAVVAGLLLLATFALGGCAAGRAGPTPTPTKTRMPTLAADNPTSAPAQAVAATATPVPIATVVPPTAAPTATAAPPTAAPTAAQPPAARLTVTNATANLRSGPGTNYGAAGSAKKGDTFLVTGKNATGDWWQINANGDPAWVAASLVSVENPQLVSEAQDIPAPPVVVAVAAPPPTKAPAPAAAPPPAAPDPCPVPGDADGCKWHVAAGPQTADNGGQELKLQLLFIHSGHGNEPQGSYFVVVPKDGQQLPISDRVRSTAKSANSGSLGQYNYEYSLGVDKLPGHSVAGNYTIWVLDGNGVRDSHNVNFTISGNQGLLYIKFDQA
jgi:uncharacterized protein YraI